MNLKNNAILKFINTNSTYVLIFIIIILINIMLGVFSSAVRLDLTENGAYSLSPVSRKAVRKLIDPLTIKLFYSDNLTSEYRSTKIYLNELLAEYKMLGDGKVIIEKYDCTEDKDDEKDNSKVQANIKKAANYRIRPQIIQKVETSKATKVKVIFGLAIICGDIIETIDFIESEKGLEFKITSVIEQINNKISTFNRLNNKNKKVNVKLMLTEELIELSQQNDVVQDLSQVKSKTEKAFKKCNARAFNTLELNIITDFKNNKQQQLIEQYQLRELPLQTHEGSEVPGVAAIAVSREKQTASGDTTNVYEIIELLQPQLALTGQGLQQIFATMELDQLKEYIDTAVDNVLDINSKIAYLQDKDCVSLEAPRSRNPMQRQQQQAEASVFNKLLSEHYTIEKIDAADLTQKDANTLIIAGPREKFTDWELFKIDQYLMQGKNLVIFNDALKETRQRSPYGRGNSVSFVPHTTGLEKMLQHYGVSLKPALIMDDVCLEPPQGRLDKVHYIPIIKEPSINNDLKIMANIKEFYNILPSPLKIVSNNIDFDKITVTPVFSSSERAWLEEKRLSARMLQFASPPDKEKMQSYVQAYIMEGEFPSYFTDKGVPAKSTNAQKKTDVKKDSFDTKKPFIKNGKPARIFVTANSRLIKDQLFKAQIGQMLGVQNNASMILNIIDYINGKKEWAVLRTKAQKYRPIAKPAEDASWFVKLFTSHELLRIYNLVLIPLLIILIGIFFYFRYQKKKKELRIKFLQQ